MVRRMASAFVVCVLVGLWAMPLWAQYTDRQAIAELGGPQEFARRRDELRKQLKTGYALLFARTLAPESNHYREDNDFFYFTGLRDIGSVLLINVENGRTTIFQPQQSERVAKVYGPNLLALAEAERNKVVSNANMLPLSELELDTIYEWSVELLRDAFRIEVRHDGAVIESERVAAPAGSLDQPRGRPRKFRPLSSSENLQEPL